VPELLAVVLAFPVEAVPVVLVVVLVPEVETVAEPPCILKV
jgi:hypothetical protein